MNRPQRPEQLSLFPDELLSWKVLSRDRQQAIEEVLSLVLERALGQGPSEGTRDQQPQHTENHHV
jgi:hypothetical protein